MLDASPLWSPLLSALDGQRRVLLTGPTGPDGDSVGACLALRRLLRDRGVDASVTGAPGYRYAWMPDASEMLSDRAVRDHPWDAVVILDGDRHRLLPGAAAAFAAAPIKGIVDHHASTNPDGYTVTWLEPTATSTCEMIYRAAVARGARLDAAMATWLYVGAIFDTGGFQHSNTTPATHHMAAELLARGIDHAAIFTRVLVERRLAGLRAAGHVYSTATSHLEGQLMVGSVPWELSQQLGLRSGDLEGVVDGLVYTVGAEVGCLLIENGTSQVKLSLRSRGGVNVSELARQLAPTGGGHARAAGAVLDSSLEAAASALVRLTRAALADG